jgi:UDP-2,3-diacylglucosamine hydrolase
LPIFLKKGALFVADAHYQKGIREEFKSFIKKLLDSPPPQLFLMGDIFDLLVGEIEATLLENKEIVEDLNRLSRVCDCFYIEGNHDFNLKKIFDNMAVIPREVQPLEVFANGKKVALLHGDLMESVGYEIYSLIIRTSIVLKILNFLNFGGKIVKKIQQYNASKNHCKKIDNFKEYVRKKRAYFKEYELVIEGHFHQNYFTKDYINLPSFSCERSYLLYDGKEFILKRDNGSLSDKSKIKAKRENSI